MRALDDVVGELLAFKRRRRGVITNSDYYLEQIPRYVRGEMREPCRSGIRTIHIDPTGQREALSRLSRPIFTGGFHGDTSRSTATPATMPAVARRRRRFALSRVRDVMA